MLTSESLQGDQGGSGMTGVKGIDGEKSIKGISGDTSMIKGVRGPRGDQGQNGTNPWIPSPQPQIVSVLLRRKSDFCCLINLIDTLNFINFWLCPTQVPVR